jgi:hypothetical protein
MGGQLAPLNERGAAGDGARRASNLENAMPLVNAGPGRDAAGTCTAPRTLLPLFTAQLFTFPR